LEGINKTQVHEQTARCAEKSLTIRRNNILELLYALCSEFSPVAAFFPQLPFFDLPTAEGVFLPVV